MNEPAYYMKLIRAFVETGEEPDATLLNSKDGISMYLAQTMHDARLKAQVLNDRIAEQVFVDTMVQFVSLCMEKAGYQMQRSSYERKQIEAAAEWSTIKRRDNWKALLQMMDDNYHEQGFDKGFYNHEMEQNDGYADDALWQTLLDDWKNHLDLRLQFKQNEFVKTREKLQDLTLRNNLKGACQYVNQHQVSENNFCQAWGLMGGRWNTYEFERLYATVKLQKRYPILQTITDKMGRVADATGNQRIGYTSGTTESMEHASQSDITGISLGRDLSSLLPSELAQFTDPEMEDVFFQKFVTSRLQTFDYQSHVLNAARSLHTKAARPRGPIIVCVDTSGSMMGEAWSIALSQSMCLAEMCTREHRPCYLIAFSVKATPIDVLHDRTQLLKFFSQKAQGDTDAQHMLDTTFTLLRSDPTYVGADVLWISDFRIPTVPLSYYQELEKLHDEGTRFYGLQLGIADNKWKSRFDYMYQIEEVKMAVR